MNTRTSGVIIAVSAAVAGSLVPSAVHAYLDNLYIIALGLGVIVAMNAGIALLHIMDRGQPAAVHDAEGKRRADSIASTQRHALAASTASIHAKRSRVASPEPRPETEAATLTPPNP